MKNFQEECDATCAILGGINYFHFIRKIGNVLLLNSALHFKAPKFHLSIALYS